MDEIAEVRNQTEFCRKETIEWQEDHMIGMKLLAVCMYVCMDGWMDVLCMCT